MPTLSARIAQVLRLALADMRREWALTICQLFAVAAVLMPLLILFGLQQGVLGRLLEDLRSNVAMREITPRVTGTNRFTTDWLRTVAARDDVAFVIGDVLSLAATLDVVNPADPGGPLVTAVLTPTAAGDPLMPVGTAAGAWADGTDRVVLSFAVAHALKAKPGDSIELLIPRSNDGLDESQVQVVTVASVLPADRIEQSRRLILVEHDLLLAVRDYRSGHAVPALDWQGDPPVAGAPEFQRFRLFAREIDDVGPLVGWLRAQGIEPVSALEHIAPIQALNRSLSTILVVISAFSAAGFAIAIGATNWNAVERKKRELALLTLIGYGRAWLMALPLVQAVVIGICGTLTAGLLYVAAAAVINANFPGVTDACSLTLAQFGMALAITCALAVAVAGLAATAVLRLEPAAVIRDV